VIHVRAHGSKIFVMNEKDASGRECNKCANKTWATAGS
jgi:hypothetical protein